MHDDQKGFGFVGVLVTVVVIGLLGLCGWLVYSSRQAENTGQDTPRQVVGQPKEEDKDTIPYENTELGIAFDYPKDWKLLDCKDGRKVIYLGSDDRGVGIINGNKHSILCSGGTDYLPQISIEVKPGNDYLGVTEPVVVAGRKAEKYTQVADNTGLYVEGLEQTVYIIDVPNGVLEASYAKWPEGSGDYNTSEQSRQRFIELVEKSLRIL